MVGEKPPYARRGRPGVQWEGCWPLAVRFLARDMRLTGAKAAGTPAALVGTGEPHVLSIFTFLRKKLIANSAFLGDSVGTPVLRDALSGRR